MDHDPLIDRLRDLGQRPVDPSTASAHLTAIAGVSRRRPGVGARAKIGAAFFAGLLVGGTGLASAGALPGSVQDAAHTTLSQVGVNVPDGHGPTRSTVGCPPDGVKYMNHGQYVRTHKNDPNAGASQCGKPVQAGAETPGVGEAPEPTEAPEAPEAPDQGKPANPGANGKGHGNGKAKGQDGQGQGEQGNATTPGPTEAPTVAPKATPVAPTSPSTTSTTKPPTTTSSSTTSTTTH